MIVGHHACGGHTLGAPGGAKQGADCGGVANPNPDCLVHRSFEKRPDCHDPRCGKFCQFTPPARALPDLEDFL